MKFFSASDSDERAGAGQPDRGSISSIDGPLNELSMDAVGDPDVLLLGWHRSARAKKWDTCTAMAESLTTSHPDDPRGWIALAETRYYEKKFQQAYDLAVLKLQQFPDSWRLLYDTACYSCLIGKRNEAEQFLLRAMAAGDAAAIRLRALTDPDLQDIYAASCLGGPEQLNPQPPG